MKFSIIVPVYNMEKYMRKCIDSLLEQSCRDYEIILVDDGSTDHSGMICNEYAEKYAAVKVIHQINQGLSGARNAGLETAAGEWVLFVDSDDWVERDMLELLEEQIRKSNADLYSWNAGKMEERGKEIEKLLFTVENETVCFGTEKESFEYYFDRLMQYQVGWEVCFRAYRKRIIEDRGLRFFPTQVVFAEDYLFTFQYMLHVKKVCSLCNVFYYYRQRTDSLVHAADKQSVLLRLYHFAEAGRQSVYAAELGYFKKNYWKLYFMLINYHICFFLADLEEENIRNAIAELSAYRLHRKWMRQIHRKKAELEQYRGASKWI